MSDAVRYPNLRILDVLTTLCVWQNKTYCFPGQATICRLLRERHGVRMSVRTLCRHLLALERDLWIRRVRRHRHDARHGFTFRSTLYSPLYRTTQRLITGAGRAVRLVKSALQSNPSVRVTKMADQLKYILRLALPPPKK